MASAGAELVNLPWQICAKSGIFPASPDFPAQAEDFPPSQGSKLSRQDSKSVTCRDPCRGKPGQEIQSGVRLDQHIFLNISIQRACQFDVEKIAKAGSQAQAQGR
ncbi:hypothetical protein V6N12_046809 [Hibiscus sabdariffa]|uniref:Uncharacterized protein n=1 Tax=Hibiscus sabdariffa TaxID=183260 RepID=A0ABR2BBK2_9ROSI